MESASPVVVLRLRQVVLGCEGSSQEGFHATRGPYYVLRTSHLIRDHQPPFLDIPCAGGLSLPRCTQK